ncbi:UDP-glucose:undecaprenyl-phosphate glucose-1-phosphate transferase [compost metagenome]
MGHKDLGVLRAHQSLLALIQRVLDLVVIAFGLFAALHVSGVEPSKEHLLALLSAFFLFHLFGDFSRLYVSWRSERLRQELRLIAGNWTLTFIGVFLLDALVVKQFALDDNPLVYWFALTLLGFGLYRVSLRVLLHAMRARGFNSRTAAIAGAGQLGQRLARTISAAPWMGLNFVGFYDDAQPDATDERNLLPRQGALEHLIVEARAGNIDRVYITLPMREEATIQWLVDNLRDTTASVYLVPDVFVFELLHARTQNIAGLPSISIFDTPMEGINRFVKRAADIVLASLILCLIALPMLAIALAVKLNSPGPVLFRQKRYGIDGTPIEVWKFRSMSVMDNGDKVVQASRNDSRVTRVGAFIRRTSLDELPQFFNVLRGEMSIVGPRPHAVAHNEEYRKLIDGYMLRHKVKPGITGWAQVNGWRGETDTLDKMQKRIEYDLNYIRHWSIWWDLKIIFLTVFKGFIGKNVY